MSFLKGIPLRPSCVVTALPRRYRESLARELKGSVAITTCPVEELEMVVHERGASLAVVGVSNNSLEIAERLSHSTNQVRVFLAHYKESDPRETPKNGFAGVFDLHDDPKNLAVTIRQAMEEARDFTSVPVGIPRRQINVLHHFIEMRRRISNFPALVESMLEGFMEITGADEGLLLIPHEYNSDAWNAVATRGYHVPKPGTELLLDSECLRALNRGEIYIPSAGILLEAPALPLALNPYLMAAPAMAEFYANAVFVGNTRNHACNLSDFLEGCSCLFDEIERKRSTLENSQLVENARKVGGASWILADIHGRVIYREGTEASWFTQNKPNVRNARLRHLLAAALKGEKGCSKVRGKQISFHPFSTVKKRYGILKVESSEAVKTDERAGFDEVAILKALLSPVLTEMPVERSICDDLISSLQSSPKNIFNFDRLKSAGIEMASTSDTISATLSNSLSLILLATKGAIFCPLNARFSQDGPRWSLIVEAPEASLPTLGFDWKNNILIHMAFKVTGLSKVQFRSARFGFQLTGVDTIS